MRLRPLVVTLAALSLAVGVYARQERPGGNGNNGGRGLGRPMGLPTQRFEPGSTGFSPASPSHLRMEGMQSRPRVIVMPRATERCSIIPTEDTWRHRDLMAEIQAMARRGFIPVLNVAGDIDALQDYAFFPAGWKAYGFVVPPGGELEVHLDHPNLGWFRLAMVNKWGSLQRGMLQNLIPKGTPMVTYKNFEKTSQQVFVIADDPGWMSSKQTPYKITVKRTCDAKKEGPGNLPQVLGIWAQHGSVEATPAAEQPSPADPGKSAPQP